MSFVSLQESISIPAAQYIHKKMMPSLNCAKAQIATRLSYLTLAGGSLIVSTIDTALGIICALGTIMSGGMHKSLPKQCFAFLQSTPTIISDLYACLLKTLNPKAKIYDKLIRNGVLTDKIAGSLFQHAMRLAQSDHLLKKHVASRLTHLLTAVVTVIARVVDGIWGVIAALLSLLTLGQYESLNIFAYRQLKVTGVISGLLFGIIHTINPWTYSGASN